MYTPAQHLYVKSMRMRREQYKRMGPHLFAEHTNFVGLLRERQQCPQNRHFIPASRRFGLRLRRFR